MDFDGSLGIYPLENYQQWQTMVGEVSEQVLDRLQPVNKVILSEQKQREFRDEEDKTMEENEKSESSMDDESSNNPTNSKDDDA